MTKVGATNEEDRGSGRKRFLKRFAMGCLGVMLLVAALITGWFFYAWEYETLRYRLTYGVETPSGPVSASAVVQTFHEDTTRLTSLGGFGHTVAGEAEVIDLGEERYLFSLLKGSTGVVGTPIALPYAAFEDDPAFQPPEGEYDNPVKFFRRLNAAKPIAGLTPDGLPLLVAFDDLDDPATVKRVDPDNLEAVFGPGVSLNSITLEITDEPVTTGEVEKVLGWFRGGTTLGQIWSNLTPSKRDVLSKGNWKKGD